jgi:signal transduction histidine kinase
MNTIRIARDASKSNQLPAKLYISSPSLKTKEKLPAQFVSDLIHEISNPLTTINLALQMLRSKDASDDRRLYLDLIKRSAERINDLITDILR